jgi:hypothetical protein
MPLQPFCGEADFADLELGLAQSACVHRNSSLS